ncbi:unnamed protein product [Rotaria magnacalcarata]|nr:unnamed protein product [Rotaria magnacalcarata]CAF3756335.1 unnamed protein product [Rotaria magnacalcarata]CAF3809956.1 unnamed protein product [Rotaria magnacalcarata]CAF3819189.1 unnamed protein product [Rotaria magnacalcarata]
MTRFDNVFQSLNDELELEAKDLNFDLNLNITYDNTQEEQDDIPEYLSVSKSTFKATFLPELCRYYHPVDFGDLQDLAIITHKLSVVNLQRKLWHTYVQCGTGQLNLKERLQKSNFTQALCIWPQQVTFTLITQHYNNVTNENEITQDVYINFVKKIQLQLDVKAAQYQSDFEIIKARIEIDSNELTEKIAKFVSKNDLTTALGLHFDTRITLIECTYIDQLFQFEYLQKNPTEQQIKLAKQICCLAFTKEKSSREHTLFRMGVYYNRIPNSLNILEEILPPSITTLTNATECERLSQQYLKIVRQTKYDLMAIMSTAATINRDENQQKYDIQMAKLWNDQHQLPHNERLSTILITLLDHRQQHILKSVEYIYEIKPDFLVKAPTIRLHIGYVPYTPSRTTFLCEKRHFILPCYPNSNVETTHINLLLTNISTDHLNQLELERRSIYGYHRPTATKPINDHQRMLFYLSRLWNVNEEILEFNFTRLKTFIDRLAIDRMQRFSTSWHKEYLHEDEDTIALEFYLQIDIDLFYMKTCSYGGAQSAIDVPKSLFCIHEPQAQYDIKPCQQLSCCLCHPSYRLTTYRSNQPIIQFGPYQQHLFVNGYRSILNCPATCTTKNIIYVLTCPCNQIDYIGETSVSLASRLSFHQAHVNRIVQEFLLGKQNTFRIRNQIKSFETLVKNDMKLYQHSVHCPSALQWFLDENPEYWSFVPQKLTESQEQDEEKDILTPMMDTNQFTYANDVPLPPNNYRFSFEQKLEIDRFFHEKKYLNSPNLHLDLYQANIVAVLPNNASEALRRFVEALFITHAETKLNTIGHLDQLTKSDSTKEIASIDCNEWCRDLVRRSYSNI